MIIDENFGLFFSFRRFTEGNIYGSRAYGFRTDWNISQSCKVHVTHSNASDWPICKNKQELSDFWAISCRFVHIVITVQYPPIPPSLFSQCCVHWTFNILSEQINLSWACSYGSSKRPCIIIFSFSLCRDHDLIFSWSRHNKSCFLVIMTSEPILSICRIHKLHGAPETPGGPLAPKDVFILVSF